MDNKNFHPNLKVPIEIFTSSDLSKLKRDYYHIIYITSGTTIVELNKKPLLIKTLDILCINNSNSIVISNNSEIEYFCCSFKPVFINDNYTFDNINNYKIKNLSSFDMDLYWLKPFLVQSNEESLRNVNLIVDKTIKNIMASISNELLKRRDKYWPCRTKSLLMELLFLVDRIYSDTIDGEKYTDITNDTLINEVLLYIHTNYNTDINLQDICEKLGTNRTSINKRFKKVTGKTIMNYLSNVRIQLSCKFLKDTHLSIIEVATKAGFSSISNFNKTFKRTTGVSPNNYRELNCK